MTSRLLLSDFLLRVEPFNHDYPESLFMQCDQVVLPCELPLLLCLNPQRVYFIHLLLFFRHIVLALLLELRQLDRDLVTLSDV